MTFKVENSFGVENLSSTELIPIILKNTSIAKQPNIGFLYEISIEKNKVFLTVYNNGSEKFQKLKDENLKIHIIVNNGLTFFKKLELNFLFLKTKSNLSSFNNEEKADFLYEMVYGIVENLNVF